MRHRSLRSLCCKGVVVGTLVIGGCNAVLDNESPTLAGDNPAPDASLLEDSSAVQPVVATDAATFDAGLAQAEDAGVVPTCGAGQKLCGGACVSVDDPLFGCGPLECAPCALPHATAACAGSGCAVSACDPGYAHCTADPASGCETDLSQPAHCGTCNTACGSSAPYCAPTSTGFACTDSCPPSAPTLCTAQCVDLTASLDDCGACGNVCPSVSNGVATCSGAHCGFSCKADFHACASACVSDQAPATCGASCAPCPQEPNAIATCDGVQCGSVCQVGYADCDGVATNGCEANLTDDPANCGRCGVSCGGRACNDGICAPPPPPDAGSSPPDAGSPPPVDAGQPPPTDAGVDSSSGPAPEDAST